ncbi:MAG: glycoside hydrolase family 97 catalytic domain-containing protein, partial [Phocaeicola sp.]
FPDGTTTFLCPQTPPMGGFARTYPSYETAYTVDQEMGQNGWGEGYTFPCLFKNNDKGWMLISETGVSSLYCASRLLGKSDGLYTIGFPQEAENNGNGTTAPGIYLPSETPWRTITLGETLQPIVETTVAFDVVKPLYEPSIDYQYTRGTWSWIMKMDASMNYQEQVNYVDFAANMGYETVLVDALWDSNLGKEKMEELARYAKEKNIGLYLWYNSNGYWNDAPQGPRHKMSNIIARRAEMKWMQSIGIKGIKVDFFGGDKQITMQLYEDILADANEYGILVIFHGCTLPRGWERMYPNFAASEAVLASENLHFSQGSCDAEAFNACLHPFIRNAVGSMDFGGSALNKRYHPMNDPDKGSIRRTSDVFALATAVLFQSPVQHFALAPNNLTDAPDWAIDFMKAIPTTWDEVRYLDGYPGKYAILARRTGDKWFVVGVNAQQESLKVKLQLPMFGAGTEIQFYSDKEDLTGSKKVVKLNKKQEIQITIPCNGGIVITQ